MTSSVQNIQLPDFSLARVLVYGDVMLDRYYHGETQRISPEAPVPVVNVSKVETRPGGAANVAQNIASLGAKVLLCGLVGEDAEAEELRRLLAALSIDCHFQSTVNCPTITKLRVLSQHQQLLRMDFEHTQDSVNENDTLFARYQALLYDVDVVVLSDYSKGALTQVERLIAAAVHLNKLVLVDPKHKDYSRYRGASLLTPNLKEFEAVVGPARDIPTITQKAQTLLQETGIDSLLVTLGKDGMVYIQPHETGVHYSAKARDVFDVTGAGDTVIGVLAASVAAGMKTTEAIELANLAAGVVVGRLGAQAVAVSDLRHSLLRSGDLAAGVLQEEQLLLLVADAKCRGEKIVMTNGCFDVLHVGHAEYLSKAKALGYRLIVAVNDDDSVRRIKGKTRPHNPLWARMKMLAALGSVDWVVSFSEDTPQRLIERISPDVLVKGGDYQVNAIAGSEHVLKNGGIVTTIPLVNGFSSSNLLSRIEEG